MRKWLVIGNLILSCNGISQVSLSVGASRMKENLVYTKDVKFFGKKQQFINDTYVFQADYFFKGLRVYGEFGFLNNRIDIEKELYYVDFYQHTSETVLEVSTVSTRYLSYKFGIGNELSKEWQKGLWVKFSYNLFCQMDVLRNHSEENHLMYQTTVTETSPGIYTTTDHAPTNPTYNLGYSHWRIYQYGLELKGRIGYGRYFGELSVSLSDFNHYRSATRYDTYDYLVSTWCFQAGFKLGVYLLTNKNNEKTTHE